VAPRYLPYRPRVSWLIANHDLSIRGHSAAITCTNRQRGEAHGAENIVVDRDSTLLEGSAGQVTVVLRFATKAAAEAWYESPEYRAIRHLRTDNTEGIGVIAEGK
jgi:uncharacterized protein (DUF1330 family)